MQTWSITLYGPAGVISTVDTGEAQFVVGTETASDVFTVVGDGVTERHAWVWISEASLQVEDLGGGTLVNGYQIIERAQVEYPASVQVGELTLVIEVKAVQPVAVSPTPSSMDITIPQRAVTKGKASLEVTIPQRTPTRSNVQKIASTGTPSAQPSSADEASTHCKYTLVKEIARGGMGQIYFGEDPQLKRNVAVKVSSLSDGGEDPRFSKEAEVLAQLAHPNIVPIHNIGVDAQGRPFYSMKLVKGRTLQAVLNLIRDGDAVATKEYPRAALLTIFRKVCDAMMFAHSKGILHRDLKPENIMVGEYGEVLVMDWGLAKVLGEHEEQSSSVSRVNDTGDYGMTMEGEVMGTPQYMSPEQAMGMVAELDQRSDIYSLGGILYAILTLRPPIEGATLDEVLTKVKNGSISSMVTRLGGRGAVRVGTPTAMGDEVPEALQAVTLKAMATDRNKRYDNVEAFACDIEAYQNGFATSAEDAGAWKHLKLWLGRNKILATSAAVLVIGGIIFTVRLAASESKARASAREAIAEREAARDSAAKAQIALAEAAERDLNGEDMQKALLHVPEDLRNESWEYLHSRLHAESLILDADSKSPWEYLLPNPTRPGKCVAVMAGQRVGELDLETGSFTEWFDRKGKWVNEAALFMDGKRMILCVSEGYNLKKQLQIISLPDGAVLSQWDLPNDMMVRRVLFSSNQRLVLLQTSNEGILSSETSRMFSVDDGKELWSKDSGDPSVGVNLGLFENNGKFRLFSERAGVLEVDPTSGEVLKNVSDPNFFPSYAPSLSRRFCLQVNDTLYIWGAHSMRKYGLSKGNIIFETRPEGLLKDVGYMSSNGYILELRQKSEKSHVLHLYSQNSPDQRMSIPWTDEDTRQPWRLCIDNKSGHIVAHNRYRMHIWKQAPLKLKYSIAVTGLNNTSQVLSDSTHFLMVQRAELITSGEWNVKSRVKPKWTIEDPNKGISVSNTQNRDTFAIRLSNEKLKIFDRKGADLVERHEVKCNLTGSIALSPSGAKIWDGIGVFETSTGKALVKAAGKMGVPSEGGPSAQWLGDSAVAEIGVLRTAGEPDSDMEMGRVISVWNAGNGQRVLQVNAPKAYVLTASPDGKWLAEGGFDMRIRVRDASTLKVVLEFRAHDSSVYSLDWHPKRPMLLSVGRDGVLKIWDLWNAQMIEKIVQDGGIPVAVSARFSADGKSVSTVGGVLSVYEPECLKAE